MPTLDANPVHQEPMRSLGAILFDLLGAVKFAVTLIVIIAALCVVGTMIPQGAEVAAYVQKNPSAAARMESFERMGLTHLFSSGGFNFLLCLLGASVSACGWRRLAAVRRTTGFARRRALGSLLAHLSLLLILTGAVIRGFWGQKGYLELREGQTLSAFQLEKGSQALPFGLRLAKFEVEGYNQPKGNADPHAGHVHTNNIESILVIQWPARALSARIPVVVGHEQKFVPPGETASDQNLFRVKVLKFLPDFYLDPVTRVAASRSDEPKNPAILVRESGPNYQREQWLFANLPDQPHQQAQGESPLRLIYQARVPTEMRLAPSGPIKSYRSTVQVVENGQVLLTRIIEVNRPFSYQGYTFYQSGYNPRDLAWTSFQVVSDPGVPVVYAGFALMIAGLFLVFYLNSWLASWRGQAAAPAVAVGLTNHPPAVPSAAPPMPLETETVASTE